MIINYSQKFTFIHVPKVAGSSITAFLAKLLGPWDIQLGAWQETVDAGTLPNLRFYCDALRPGRFIRTTSRLFRARNRIDMLSSAQKSKYVRSLGEKPQHATAERIAAFDPEAWRSHTKFCFVRNPYARMVSHYQYEEKNRSQRGLPGYSFSEFLARIVPVNESGTVIGDMSKMYTINGSVAVDFVGRFEQLERDLREICSILRIPSDLSPLPHAKASRPRNYQDFYTSADREIVKQLSEFEIDTFKYAF